MEGALNGYAQVQNMNIDQTSLVNTIGRIFAATSAMIVAVGLSSGKVIFGWIKKSKMIT